MKCSDLKMSINIERLFRLEIFKEAFTPLNRWLANIRRWMYLYLVLISDGIKYIGSGFESDCIVSNSFTSTSIKKHYFQVDSNLDEKGLNSLCIRTLRNVSGTCKYNRTLTIYRFEPFMITYFNQEFSIRCQCVICFRWKLPMTK